jgi:four helix bundle protein
MERVENYTDLVVWNRGRALVRETYALTTGFPSTETYGLTSQMRRASVSVPSNIAEGFSRRGTKDYIQFVSMAIGSLAELDTQSYLAEDLRYISSQAAIEYRNSVKDLLRMLQSMRSKLKSREKNNA